MVQHAEGIHVVERSVGKRQPQQIGLHAVDVVDPVRVPRRLLDTAYYSGFTSRGAYLRGYDVSRDGKQFLMIKGSGEAVASQTVLTVVTNWPQR